MILKDYQNETLETLRQYLKLCRLVGPAVAYKDITAEPAQRARLGKYAQDYQALSGLENIPYVCLRLPTGGGKTILAARSIGIVRDAWLEKTFPTVLWLVPTKTIREQTVEALKNPRHPYRQQMDELFEGRVRVFDIGDFTHIRPQDIRDNLTVIVGTIQTLKVASTEGRKVYAHNEHMESHFTGLTANTDGLEKQNGSNQVKFSFANLLHMVHPIMIVDEAHNAVTNLSREMQQRVSPGCIVEFTATPRFNSNILHSVTAQELKDEEMIKLPVVLAEHQNWQSAVDGAVQRRQELANVAEKDSRGIRPIVLFQAQKKDKEVTVGVLKEYLVETSGIRDHKIAVVTGEQRELDGIDLFDPQCSVEFVITIEALKEGWDCSFAYVFCSVASIRSATAVEQLLGRVLRMPFAEKGDQPELNRSYAHVSEPVFSEAANALRDKLVAMGFDEEEAAQNIEPALWDESELGGQWGAAPQPKPKISVTLDGGFDISTIAEEDQAAVTIAPTPDGQVEVTVTGYVSDDTLATVENAVPEQEREGFRERATEYRHRVEKELSPAARRVPFIIPRLVTEIQGKIEFADPDIFDENHDWSLPDPPAKLGEDVFAIREEAHIFEVDLDGQRLAFSHVSQNETFSHDTDVEGWTETNLVLALDKQLAHPRFGQLERMKWCLAHVQHLTGERGISLSALWRAKFVLARKLGELIEDMKAKEAKNAWQQNLFNSEARPDVSFDQPFEFREGMYANKKTYRGSFKFTKHFLEVVPEIDGGDKGEEFQCALALDSLPETRHWLRNVAGLDEVSFRLPVVGGWTYPDFVAELTDGRLLVVEYKGELLLDSLKTREKVMIGELWEKKMSGKGLYIMAVKKDEQGRDVRAQLMAKVAG